MASARLGCVDGRAVLITTSLTGYIDIEKISGGKLSGDPMACLENWVEVCKVATNLSQADESSAIALDANKLECPVPRPRQIFAIGINYKAHAAEMNNPLPTQPLVFTKFQSSLNSPNGAVTLVGEKCDFEAELVAIIAKGGRNISRENAYDHIFGYACLIDMVVRGKEERVMRKSYDTFCPFGPWITTADEVPNPANLQTRLWVNDELRQDANTKDLIVDIPGMIELSSKVATLYPGDIIAAGTPAGVGPVQPGDRVRIQIEHVGEMTLLVK
jgi:2-keto-4-pentenoate hydratase/2-oxohepta-3-ene-1,7-dioic acid hydratase in catechol pathway